MKNYILVHGAWGAAAEFNTVANLLTAAGNNVIAIDLPGHGKNKAPIATVTMDAYVQKVTNVIQKIDQQVILIGHSLAGAIISQVAEVIPERIERLIYVAAALPKTGDTVLGLMQSDATGELLPKIIFSDDQSYATLNEADIRNILLHDVIDEDVLTESLPLFSIKQATQPFMVPAQLSKEKFGAVPKYFIRASLDKVMSLSLQNQMIANWKVEQIFTLESGHFPLTSIPGHLVATIRKASRPVVQKLHTFNVNQKDISTATKAAA